MARESGNYDFDRVVGEVRDWPEHQWSVVDRDSFVVDVNDAMRGVQEDFRSILQFAMQRWRIEVKEDEDRQQILKVVEVKAMSISSDVLNTYIDAQRDLIQFEDVDKNSCLVSLPLHFAAHTRVELAITQVSANQFVLSDQGQTLGELKDAGYSISRKLQERIKEIIRIWHIDLVGVKLIF